MTMVLKFIPFVIGILLILAAHILDVSNSAYLLLVALGGGTCVVWFVANLRDKHDPNVPDVKSPLKTPGPGQG